LVFVVVVASFLLLKGIKPLKEREREGGSMNQKEKKICLLL